MTLNNARTSFPCAGSLHAAAGDRQAERRHGGRAARAVMEGMKGVAVIRGVETVTSVGRGGNEVEEITWGDQWLGGQWR